MIARSDHKQRQSMTIHRNWPIQTSDEITADELTAVAQIVVLCGGVADAKRVLSTMRDMEQQLPPLSPFD